MPTTATQRKVGRYRLESLIGKGGMAEVYGARDGKLDRSVAIKMILPNLVSQHAFLERFLREARLVAALEHPNILPIYDFGEQDGVPYLVMPRMTGGTLAECIGQSGLAPERVCDYILQLADALDTAHGAGILHRDLKPSNVLMDRNERPVLADFGLARVADAASDLTGTGVMVGTPLYMAPELAQGTPASAATDLYALGVLAYQMLCGNTPFVADSPVAVLHQHVNKDVPELSHRLPGSPPAVDEFFRHALAKRSEQRFSSGNELACALAESLGVPTGAPQRAGEAASTSPSIATTRHPTDVAISGSVRAVPAARAKPPASVVAEPRRAGLGSSWALALVVLFAVLGVLLGSRSLIGRAGRVTDSPNEAANAAAVTVPAATDPAETDEMSPQQSGTLRNALSLRRQGRHEEAIEEARSLYARVSAGSPENAARLLQFIAHEYVELERWDDAVSSYGEAVLLGGPAAAQAGTEGGRIALEKLHDPETARELFQAACDAGNPLACRRVAALRGGRSRR